MAQGNVSQAIASQHEYMDPKLTDLFSIEFPLWKLIKTGPEKAVSNRPVRIAFKAIGGGKFRTAGFDGQSLGRGSAPTEIFGNVSCVSFSQATEYTALAQYSTNSDEKAIKDYVAMTQADALSSFAAQMEALVIKGDGANSLAIVTGTVTGGLILDNANKIFSNQDVDLWTGVNGTFLGTVTALSIDIANNTVWTTGSVPAGVVAGGVVMASGSSGLSNTGILGFEYYMSAGNTGNYMGIQRSAFPRLFSTPTYDLAGAALTPAAVRVLEAQVRLAIGSSKADSLDLVAHMGVEGQAAWENNSILVQSVIANQIKGDTAVDMLQKNAPKVIAGRVIIANERATPGVINFLSLKDWSRISTKELGLYGKEECAGQTLFPAYGSDGSVATSIMAWYTVMCNFVNRNPRSGGVIKNFAIPTGYFGR